MSEEEEVSDYWVLNPLHIEFKSIPKKIKSFKVPEETVDKTNNEFKLHELGWINYENNFMSKLMKRFNSFSKK